MQNVCYPFYCTSNLLEHITGVAFRFDNKIPKVSYLEAIVCIHAAQAPPPPRPLHHHLYLRSPCVYIAPDFPACFAKFAKLR